MHVCATLRVKVLVFNDCLEGGLLGFEYVYGACVDMHLLHILVYVWVLYFSQRLRPALMLCDVGPGMGIVAELEGFVLGVSQ